MQINVLNHRDELDDASPNRGSFRGNCKSWPSVPKTPRRSRRGRSTGTCDVVNMRKNDRRRVDQRLLAAAMKQNSDCHRDSHELLDHFQPCNRRSSKDHCPSVVLDINGPESDNSKVACGSRKAFNTSTTKALNVKSCTKVDECASKLVRKFSRFGFGVEENCSSNLCIGTYKTNASIRKRVDPRELVESSVLLWENSGRGRKQSCKV